MGGISLFVFQFPDEAGHHADGNIADNGDRADEDGEIDSAGHIIQDGVDQQRGIQNNDNNGFQNGIHNGPPDSAFLDKIISARGLSVKEHCASSRETGKTGQK